MVEPQCFHGWAAVDPWWSPSGPAMQLQEIHMVESRGIHGGVSVDFESRWTQGGLQLDPW